MFPLAYIVLLVECIVSIMLNEITVTVLVVPVKITY